MLGKCILLAPPDLAVCTCLYLTGAEQRGCQSQPPPGETYRPDAARRPSVYEAEALMQPAEQTCRLYG